MLSRIRSNLTFSNVLALVALFVALGGGAYAAAGNPFVSGSGKIQGCVKSGALNVVKAGKHCPSGTTSLAFSQTGPRGKTGSSGTAGTAGTSAAYFAYGAGAGVVFSNSLGTATPILTKTGVPAGTYAITGKVNLAAADTHPGSNAQVTCELDDVPTSGATVGDSDGWTPYTQALVGNSFQSQTTLSFGLDLTTTGTTTIAIKCTDRANNNTTTAFTLTATNAEISAVRVGALA